MGVKFRLHGRCTVSCVPVDTKKLRFCENHGMDDRLAARFLRFQLYKHVRYMGDYGMETKARKVLKFFLEFYR